MTVINQNSISGITSITAASGSVQIFNSDGSSGSLTDLAGINVAGVVTATTYKVGAGVTVDASGINVAGVVTATSYSGASDTIKFETGGSERVRIDANGNFNLVNTAGIMTAFKYETPALINNHFKSNSTSSGDYVRLYAGSGTGKWDIYGNAANLRFSDNDSAGNIQMDRPLVMNSQNIVMSSGNGIDFSATADGGGTANSELLDDYEEGIWSPTIRGNPTAGTATYAEQHGSYVKVGRLVTVTMYLQWSSGTGTGTMLVGNLPFVTANDFDYICTGAVMANLITYTGKDYLVLYSGYNTTNLPVYASTSNAVWANIDYDPAGSIIASITYQTAS